MTKIIINFIAIITLGIIQVSFLTTWPKPVSNLNLILSLVIFLILISRYQQGLWWALGGGLFLEIFSFELFGLATLSLILTAVLINFLFNNFFTNYSFYSLTILGLAGTLSYNLITLVIKLAVSFLGLQILAGSLMPNFFSYLGWQLVLNLIILYAIFSIFYFLSRRLKIDLPAS